MSSDAPVYSITDEDRIVRRLQEKVAMLARSVGLSGPLSHHYRDPTVAWRLELFRYVPGGGGSEVVLHAEAESRHEALELLSRALIRRAREHIAAVHVNIATVQNLLPLETP